MTTHRLPVAVIGAGAWGTALACAMAAIAPVQLWARTPPPPGTRTMPRLSGITLPENVEVINTFPQQARAILLVAPTQALRTISSQVEQHLAPGIPVIVCCKGIEKETGCLPFDIIEQTMGTRPRAVLSGPNFAQEVALGLPAAATLAAKDHTLAQDLAKQLSTPTFHLYTSTDPLGVQLAGAAKNVIAIGAGLCIGANLGENARAALITCALAELGQLIVAMGGKAETAFGLAGLGDLLLTATGQGSRNYSLGMALGEGQTLTDILSQRSTVTEGVLTAPILFHLAHHYGVKTPIIQAIAHLLDGTFTLAQARAELFDQPFLHE